MPRNPLLIRGYYPRTKDRNARVQTDEGVLILGYYKNEGMKKRRYGIFSGRWFPFVRNQGGFIDVKKK